MAASDVTSAAALAAGIAAHVLYFQRYEYHRQLNTLIAVAASSPFVLTAFFTKFLDCALLAAVRVTFWTMGCFVLGAVGSTLIYRLFFHPLNKFPGPFTARLTDFWVAITVGKNLNQYRRLEVLHRKYGPIVRTGASHISVVDPEILDLAFHPNKAVASKGPWYDVNYPVPALAEERDRKVHDARRKLWVPAFSDKALRAYEEHILEFSDKFLERIAEFNGGPVNVSKWFNLYAFDIMGTLAFGKNYGLLDSGERHDVLSLVTEGMAPLGLTLPTWFSILVKKLPFDSLGLKRFLDFCKHELAETVQNMNKDEKAVAGSTITSWLYLIYKDEEHPEENPLFIRDAVLLIVAGSDTTAASLTYLFYLLAQNPEDVRKIREELEPVTQGEWSHKDITNCDHLNGAINEQQRLFPPGPTGGYRYTPPEGMQLGETHIPGRITFNVPTYITNRDEAVYADAEAFIPERWYSKPDLIRNKTCFYPFSAGSMGCIGKNLALMEIRILTAKLLLNYDVSLAPGEDGNRLMWKSKDHFTMSLAPCDLVFTPREV